MKYISIDIETTGLNPETCQTIEFGAILDNLCGTIKPIEQLPRFHCYLTPESNIYTGEPYALSMHPEKFRRIATRDPGYVYISGSKLGILFKNFLVENGYNIEDSKIHINVAGKNFGAFDLQFLKKLDGWEKHIKVRHRIIDPAILFWKFGDESLPGTEECLKRIGNNNLSAHDSLSDCEDVIRLVRDRLIP